MARPAPLLCPPLENGGMERRVFPGRTSLAVGLNRIARLASECLEMEAAWFLGAGTDDTERLVGEALGVRDWVSGEHPLAPGGCFVASPLRAKDGKRVGVLWARTSPEGPLEGRTRRILAGFAALAEDAVRAHTEWPAPVQADHGELCPLTGLLARPAGLARVHDLLVSASEADRPVALLIADIADFNAINSAFGRETGDRLLRKAADRIRRLVPRDALVFRVQGDQFGIALEVDDAGAAIDALLSTLATGFDAPLAVRDREVVLNLVVGTALFPHRASSAAELLDRAFLALRRAQAQRMPAEVFTTELEERLVREVAVEQRLRAALVERRLAVVYQPKVSLSTGEMESVEALCRWTDPELGPVSPAEFIPAAERAGLIAELGKIVIETALTDVKRLRELRPTASVSVNVAAAQLRRSDFVEEVARLLVKSGVPADALELEVVETSFIQDMDGAVAIIERLRSLGVAFSIDDFGTGYSSLAYLRRLPVQTLKIDRGFIHNMTASDRDAALVRSIISMAHLLDFQVVAEGVETAVQAALLCEMGCDAGQGYFWARPEPLEAVLDRLRTPPDV